MCKMVKNNSSHKRRLFEIGNEQSYKKNKKIESPKMTSKILYELLFMSSYQI